MHSFSDAWDTCKFGGGESELTSGADIFQCAVFQEWLPSNGSSWMTARSAASTAPEPRCWKRYRKTCARRVSGSALPTPPSRGSRLAGTLWSAGGTRRGCAIHHTQIEKNRSAFWKSQRVRFRVSRLMRRRVFLRIRSFLLLLPILSRPSNRSRSMLFDCWILPVVEARRYGIYESRPRLYLYD